MGAGQILKAIFVLRGRHVGEPVKPWMNSLGRWSIILPRIDVEAVEIRDDEQRRIFQVLAIAEKLLAGFEEVRRLRLYSKASALDPAAAQRRGPGPASARSTRPTR